MQNQTWSHQIMIMTENKKKQAFEDLWSQDEGRSNKTETFIFTWDKSLSDSQNFGFIGFKICDIIDPGLAQNPSFS